MHLMNAMWCPAGRLYHEAWEYAYEQSGPIRESLHPDLHQCPGDRVPFGSFMGKDGWRQSELVNRVVPGHLRVLDLGGGQVNTIPGSLNWDLAMGRDMRDVESWVSKGPYDLIYSSHSIEHIPSADAQLVISRIPKALMNGGELLLIAPHRCSGVLSPYLNRDVQNVHLWCPTAACIGNFLLHLGMEMIDMNPHDCDDNTFWIWMRKV